MGWLEKGGGWLEKGGGWLEKGRLEKALSISTEVLTMRVVECMAWMYPLVVVI
jgi:hypothetical protein